MIAVLDFGGQYAHLIADRIRRLRVYAEIFPSDASPRRLQDVEGIVLSGGPASVYDPGAPPFDEEVLELGVPVLGICYGHQLMAYVLGGEVRPGGTREYGIARLQVLEEDEVLRGLGPSETVWMSHGDQVVRVPPGFRVLARTPDCPVAAMGDPERKLYGLQFHPEVTHTPKGMRVLDNFLEVCGARRTWDMERFLEGIEEEIRRKVGGRKVFLLVSGGVDSTVSFVLLTKVLGKDRVYGLFVDNGFLRKGEREQVEGTLGTFGRVHTVDASEDFLRAVEGVVDPEEKRRRIGETFVRVMRREADALGLNPEEWVLGQGTIYPDTIESGGTRNSAVIKTHHNRVEAIRRLLEEGRVVEPLSQLYKDEVRRVGERLGLPEDVVWRHPFPGPGLAVRVLCSDGKGFPFPKELSEGVEKVADKFGLEAEVLPIRSVGVQGDFRTYAHPVLISGEADWGTLEEVSTSITNSVEGVNRVVWELTPLKARRPMRATLTRERLDLLREADFRAHEVLRGWGLEREVWQMPVVLVPLGDGRETVVLRPVCSQEAMTAQFAKLPLEAVREMAEAVLSVPGVGAVLYDVTHKPPGTIEWE